ncbi:hypothetical protein [Nocardioides aurantiacus]|uniref:hypothetical protein n=1 Tax=Nocardioides aurantiacus TaxID=86796 RepID=UPI003CCC892B
MDAVAVRSLLAPALVGVLGRANWTLPRWLGAVVRLSGGSRGPGSPRGGRGRPGRRGRWGGP